MWKYRKKTKYKSQIFMWTSSEMLKRYVCESVTNLAKELSWQLHGLFSSCPSIKGTPHLSQGLDVLDMFNSCAIF